MTSIIAPRSPAGLPSIRAVLEAGPVFGETEDIRGGKGIGRTGGRRSSASPTPAYVHDWWSRPRSRVLRQSARGEGIACDCALRRSSTGSASARRERARRPPLSNAAAAARARGPDAREEESLREAQQMRARAGEQRSKRCSVRPAQHRCARHAECQRDEAASRGRAGMKRAGRSSRQRAMATGSSAQ